MSDRHGRLPDVPYFPEWQSYHWENLAKDQELQYSFPTERRNNSNSHEFGKVDPRRNSSARMSNESMSYSEGRCPWGPVGHSEKDTKEDDHQSQLVDALKVGLADILSSSRREDASFQKDSSAHLFSEDPQSRCYDMFRRSPIDALSAARTNYYSPSASDYLEQFNRGEYFRRRPSFSRDDFQEDGVSDLSTSESRSSVNGDFDNGNSESNQGDNEGDCYTDSSGSERVEQSEEQKPDDGSPRIKGADFPPKEEDFNVESQVIDKEERFKVPAFPAIPEEEDDLGEKSSDENIIIEKDSYCMKDQNDLNKEADPVLKWDEAEPVENQVVRNESTEVAGTSLDDIITKLEKEERESLKEFDKGNEDDEFLLPKECDDCKPPSLSKTPSPKKRDHKKGMALEGAKSGDVRKLGSTIEPVIHPQSAPTAIIPPAPPPPQPFNPWLSPEKRSYAEVLKLGLQNAAKQNFGKQMSLFPPLRSPKETRKASRKTRKERRRGDRTGKKESDTRSSPRKNGSPRHSTRASGVVCQSGTPSDKSEVDKRGKPQASGSSGTHRKAGSSLEHREMGGLEDWQDETPEDTSVISQLDETFVAEELLREKIKTEQIAMLLQEAKLTLTKLTTECLGSYEKVSSLKAKKGPVTCTQTIRALQTQEVNKALHMKELANRLHQLTEFGIGNAEEFREIKDILNSLHYLQTRDKYFVEQGGKNLDQDGKPSKYQLEKSSLFFAFGALAFLLFLYLFQGDWLVFGILGLLLASCFYYEREIIATVETFIEKENPNSK